MGTGCHRFLYFKFGKSQLSKASGGGAGAGDKVFRGILHRPWRGKGGAGIICTPGGKGVVGSYEVARIG